MNWHTFKKELGERMARGGLGAGHKVEIIRLPRYDMPIGDNLCIVRVDDVEWCSLTEICTGTDWHLCDITWKADRLGQPCLAFKGINKFLRKREVAP